MCMKLMAIAETHPTTWARAVRRKRDVLGLPRADSWADRDCAAMTRNGRKRLAQKYMDEVVRPALDEVELAWSAAELAKYPHTEAGAAHNLATPGVSFAAFQTWACIRLRGVLPEWHTSTGRCFLCHSSVGNVLEHLSECTVASQLG